jgi:hypothetical protein
MARKEGSESRYPPLKNSSPGVHNGASAGRVACTGEREREREREREWRERRRVVRER